MPTCSMGNGTPTVNLTSGMMKVHSDAEYMPLDELERSCEVVLRLIAEAGRLMARDS